MEPSLPQGVGYGIVIGLGAFFAALLNFVTYIQNRFTKVNSNKIDEFTSASRNIPFGLMVCSIVSSWTWSLTLLQSATESYNMGFCGSYWYAVGGLLQVSVFSIVALKVKQNANLVTTFPEMGFFRFGNAGHLSFLFCGLVCNAIVSSCILLGGSAVVTAITGMNSYAALMLIPLGVAVYVSFGGLRATFIADATHTLVLIIFVIVFVFKVYTAGDIIGSPQRMHDLLQLLEPVADNYHGSYLTFRSKQGAIFAIVSIINGFGLVTCDQAYWSRAIASDPKKTSLAYFYAAGAWFVIPFAMGASLGLAGRALTKFADFPHLLDDEVSAGLVSVAAVTYLMGKTGSAMILVVVFLSVTSSFSGELIATSTLLSYDVYKKYIRPEAHVKEVIIIAKVSVFIWALFAGGLACIFKGAAHISMGWLFNFLGVCTASGVIPIVLSFLWKDLNKWGAVLGSVGGMVLSFIVWLITCKYYVGEINVVNLSEQWVSFAGCVSALMLGGIISVTLSLMWPANFDWDKTRNRTILLDATTEFNDAEFNRNDLDNETRIKPEVFSLEDSLQNDAGNMIDDESKLKHPDQVSVISGQTDEDSVTPGIDHKQLEHQFKKYTILVLVSAIVAAIVVPVSLGASPYVFSITFFTSFIAIIIVWLFYSLSLVIVWPIWEARLDMWQVVKAMF